MRRNERTTDCFVVSYRPLLLGLHFFENQCFKTHAHTKAELFLHSNDFTGGDIEFLCDNIDRLGGIGRGTISTDQNITCRCCLTWD